MKQLRLTTSKPGFFGAVGQPLVRPEGHGKVNYAQTQGDAAFLHGDAEELAGYDIVILIDGDLQQLDAPEDQQDILLMLPSGEYPVIATLPKDNTYYLITLKQPIIKKGDTDNGL